MRLVIDLTGLQSQSRFRGIGRYTRGLCAGLLRTAGDHEVWLTACENQRESLQSIRESFKDLVSPHRLLTYKLMDHVSHGDSGHRWRRIASEHVREHFLGSLGADVILLSSMFEGFEEDIVTSAGVLCDDAVQAVIAYDLIR